MVMMREASLIRSLFCMAGISNRVPAARNCRDDKVFGCRYNLKP